MSIYEVKLAVTPWGSWPRGALGQPVHPLLSPPLLLRVWHQGSRGM